MSISTSTSVGMSICFCILECNMVYYSTVQYSTVQYSTVQYSAVQYSTVQHRNGYMELLLHVELLTRSLDYGPCGSHGGPASETVIGKSKGTVELREAQAESKKGSETGSMELPGQA